MYGNRIVTTIVIFILVTVAFASSAQASVIADYTLNGNASDSSGNGLTATAVSNVTWNADYYGRSAAVFNGYTSYITLPFKLDASIYPTLTICAWVNEANPSGSSSYLQMIVNNDNFNYSRALFEENLSGATWSSNVQGPDAQLRGSALTVNQWAFVAVAYSPTSTILYVNGTTYTSTANQASTGLYAAIGASAGGLTNQQNFDGAISSVSFYNTALSAGALNAIMLPDPTTPALLLGLGAMVAMLTRRRS